MRQNYADCHSQPSFHRKLDAAANAAATITVAADADQFHALDWVGWSYDATPTGGKLTVAIGGVTFAEADITSAGPGMLRFDPPLYNSEQTKSEAMVITLAAAGAGVTGKVYARVR